MWAVVLKKISEIVWILQELNVRYVTSIQHQFETYRNNLEDLACLSSQHVVLGIPNHKLMELWRCCL